MFAQTDIIKSKNPATTRESEMGAHVGIVVVEPGPEPFCGNDLMEEGD